MNLLRSAFLFLFAAMLPSVGLAFSDPLTSDETSRSWQDSFQAGGGSLSLGENGLVFVVEEAEERNFDYRYLREGRYRYNQPFAAEVSILNDTIPESSRELCSIGIEVYSAEDLTNRASVALSVSRIEGFFSRVVFSQVVESGETQDSGFSAPVGTEIRVRMSYDPEERSFTASYREVDGEEDDWVEVTSFRIDGEDGSADWDMRGSDRFFVYLYGYTEHLDVFLGEAVMTDFAIATE